MLVGCEAMQFGRYMTVQKGRPEDGAGIFLEMVILIYQSIQRHNPADYNINIHFCEKLKFYKGNVLFYNY